MKDKRHLIVVDPTAFSGGSKVATESILDLVDAQQFRITVLTADKTSWLGPNIKRVHLVEPKMLAQKEQGIGYFIRHAFIALNLLLVRLRFGAFDIALGASGPGVDLALYLLRPLMKFKIIQLIHGPVAKSRTIARCLNAAHQVHYLHSSSDSLQNALSLFGVNKVQLPNNFYLLQNGLSEYKWPTACQMYKPTVFWAASLLKWKGLETLLDALQMLTSNNRPQTYICYIKPKGVQLPVTDGPVKISKVNWFECPTNLDQLRANANIFVSTSKHEPFGLSILEAMAAGQCVLIPADGAYWDKVLIDNVNCIKYQPDNANDLKQKILMLSNNMGLVATLGQQASSLALHYRASKQYKNIVDSILASVKQTAKNNSLARRSL